MMLIAFTKKAEFRFLKLIKHYFSKLSFIINPSLSQNFKTLKQTLQ